MKHTKLITIGALPLMWIIYFIFELITGRITTISSFTFNVGNTSKNGLLIPV